MLFGISILAAIVSSFVYLNSRKKFNKVEELISGLGAIVAIFIAITQFITFIPAGHVGIVDFMGSVSDNTLKSGINFVNPMSNVVKFNIKRQEIREVITAPSKEGLNVQIEISLQYSLSASTLSRIYNEVGENYKEELLNSNLKSVIGNVTANYDAKSIFTSARSEISAKVIEGMKKIVSDKGITIINAPIRQIILPSGFMAAIEERLKAEQESQKMEMLLKKEEMEANRKKIEAQGIADFQKIVSQGLTPQVLQWKGIEATEKLANSNNSKVIVIGSNKSGLPLILGN